MGLCQSKPRVGGGNRKGLRPSNKPRAGGREYSDGREPPSPWADLPPELAGQIFARLPSLDDRLRFRAVCRDWRLAARRQRPLPPPGSAPWVHLGNGAYRSLLGGGGRDHTALRFAAPGGCRAMASFGGWVLFWDMPTRRCFLRDPFPGAAPVLELPCRYHALNRRPAADVSGDCQPRTMAACSPPALPHEHAVVKIVVCSPNLVAAIFAGSAFDSAPVNFACFRTGLQPPRPPFLFGPAPEPPLFFFWLPPTADYQRRQSRDGCYSYKEIAFHRGKVFAVSSREELFAHELPDDGETPPWQSRVELVISQPPAAPAPWPCATQDCYHHHLVTASDDQQQQKLLMVRWNIPHCCWAGLDLGCDRRRVMDLQVFEADLERRRWAEIKDIGRQDLYVCRAGSRALDAAAAGPTEDHGRVFVMVSERASAGALCKCCHCRKLVEKGVPTYCVYDVMSGEVGLVSLNGEDSDAPRKYVRSEWFFPDSQ